MTTFLMNFISPLPSLCLETVLPSEQGSSLISSPPSLLNCCYRFAGKALQEKTFTACSKSSQEQNSAKCSCGDLFVVIRSSAYDLLIALRVIAMAMELATISRLE